VTSRCGARCGMVRVVGLHRSGTSLLQFLVGALPGYVALGEIRSLIESTSAIGHATESTCSCGNTIARCPFWGDIVRNLTGDGDYQPVLNRFVEMYPGRTIVDSSKGLEIPEGVSKAKVLLCIRDVRGWAVSHRRPTVRGFISWYTENRALIRKLADSEYLRVSYDELALRTEPALRRITDFLGVAPTPSPRIDFRNSEHHAVHVNKMKNDPAKMAGIRYDHRWLRDTRWSIAAAALPFVMKFNREQVYGTVPNEFVETDTCSSRLV